MEKKANNEFIHFILVFVLISFNLYGASNTQYLYGDAPEFKLKGNSDSPFLSGSSELKIIKNKDTSSVFIPLGEFNKLDKLSEKNKLDKPVIVSGFSQEISGDGSLNSSESLSYDDMKMFYRDYNKGKSSFSFSYYLDNFNVIDSNNIFNRTFNDNGTRGGYLIFGFDYSLFKSKINLLFGYDFGFSYSHGNGVFVGKDISTTDIKFWVIPLEFYLKLEVPIWTWSKISFYGGPSVVGLWQTRSDMSKGESIGNTHQSRRQVGYGYLAGTKLSLSLSRWLGSTFLNMKKSYDISNFYLTFEGRLQNYGNFLDPLEIKGVSYGLGFAVDFL